MVLSFLPEDINIEDLLSYLPENSFRISFNGLHKRNTYGDIINYEETTDGKLEFQIGRNGIYNILPEYVFHPVNRYDNIPDRERKERLAEEYAKQELEKEHARKFFSPIDALLLDLKMKTKSKINQYASSNIVLQEIIGDTLSEEQRSNRFVRRVVPFLPQCKNIRGNMTLITFILRHVLFEEGIILRKEEVACQMSDTHPQYNCSIEDCDISSMYVGNEYYEPVTTYNIQYWSENECTAQFETFLKDLECFRLFIQDYFLSIEEQLKFNIVTDGPPLRLSDEVVYSYLNFNANI